MVDSSDFAKAMADANGKIASKMMAAVIEMSWSMTARLMSCVWRSASSGTAACSFISIGVAAVLHEMRGRDA